MTDSGAGKLDLSAHVEDAAGNVEKRPHRIGVRRDDR
jgi:hypothetical protein